MSLAEPKQLDFGHNSHLADALSSHQERLEQGSSSVSSLRLACALTSTTNAHTDSAHHKPDQGTAPANELSSVFDFL